MNKHAQDSANGVCKAHVLTMPVKDSNSAPPTSNWTRRELFPAEGEGTIGNQTGSGPTDDVCMWTLYILIVEPDHTRGLNNCDQIISLISLLV